MQLLENFKLHVWLALPIYWTVECWSGTSSNSDQLSQHFAKLQNWERRWTSTSNQFFLKDVNKWRPILFLQIRKLEIMYKYQFSSNLSEFNVISTKIPTGLFMNLDKLILKYMWRSKKKKSKTFLRKKSKGCALLDIKAYYKAVMIKSIWNWHRNWKILTDGTKWRSGK